MAIRIGLMGFGRIGRNLFRILYKRDDLRVEPGSRRSAVLRDGLRVAVALEDTGVSRARGDAAATVGPAPAAGASSNRAPA